MTGDGLRHLALWLFLAGGLLLALGTALNLIARSKP